MIVPPIKVTKSLWRNGWFWGQSREKYKISLEYLVLPQSKAVLKKKIKGWGQRDTGSNLNGLPMTKAGSI